jgi:glutamine synthetase
MPLLRSESKLLNIKKDAINKEGIRLLRNIGDSTSERVISMVGCEQEFFVIEREHYLNRPDLIASGRTLIGALPSRNQQTEVNYFAVIPPRVRKFLEEAQQELWSVGVI